jgi:phosphotransferase system HPr-like phosphotransfer protein
VQEAAEKQLIALGSDAKKATQDLGRLLQDKDFL